MPPPPNNGWEQGFEISGKPAAKEQRVRINLVSPEYFTVLRIPLMQGRIWDESEMIHEAKLALISIHLKLFQHFFDRNLARLANQGSVENTVRVLFSKPRAEQDASSPPFV